MFQTIFIGPLYNAFILLIGAMPGGDVGLAIIVLTLVIRGVFYPAFAASIRTQMGMQQAQPEVDEINAKYKDDAAERARRTMEVFKKYKVRPFANIVALLVQVPVFIALYFSFVREGLPNVDTHLLYSFVHTPAVVNTTFLGFLNLLQPHVIVLALMVGFLQYLVAYFSSARTKVPLAASADKAAMHLMQKRMMLYFLPTLMTFVAYSLPAAAGLYFTASNLVSLAQEFLIRRHKEPAI